MCTWFKNGIESSRDDFRRRQWHNLTSGSRDYVTTVSTDNMRWRTARGTLRGSLTSRVRWMTSLRLYLPSAQRCLLPIVSLYRYIHPDIMYTIFCLLRAPPLIRVPPIVWGEGKSIINDQNAHSFLNNCPIFNPKLPLESSEPQLFTHNIRCDLANAPCTLIR